MKAIIIEMSQIISDLKNQLDTVQEAHKNKSEAYRELSNEHTSVRHKLIMANTDKHELKESLSREEALSESRRKALCEAVGLSVDASYDAIIDKCEEENELPDPEKNKS